jgi:2-polyprenyl-6-hydroxyphenyl methylase / 3-demethylubiquinone-9 3-methyltransferase
LIQKPAHVAGFFMDNPRMSQNFDTAELAKFTDLAHDWWNKDSPSFGALHAINPLRLDWIDSLAAIDSKRILDVGCGGGILADSMAHKGAHVLGIDLGEESLKIAQLHALEAQTPSIKYQKISAEDLAAAAPASFDVVTCMEMLEHVPDPAAVVEACSNLVKPGGWVFFSTINRNLKAFASAIVAGEYLLGLLPRGTHEYAKFIQPAELMRWARGAGLNPQATRGLGYSPITQRYSLNADTSVNYMIATQKV